MIDKIPNSWAILSLESVIRHTKGKKPKFLNPIPTKGFVPYIDIKAFEFSEIRQYADIKSSKLANEKDVLVVWDGARSGLAGYGQNGAIGSTIMALTPTSIQPEYLFRFLQSQYDYINSNPRGTGIPHVDPEIFWKIKLPIAPYNEQGRIVAKLEKILAKVNKCKERLEKIPTILKRFRQSVLSTVCSGDLTADWRKKRGINHSWERIKLKDAADKIQIGPFGSLLHKSDYVDNKISVINPTHIKTGKIVPAKNVTINASKRSELKRYVLQQGDIVVARRGEMGRCAVVRGDQDGWVCGTGSLFVRPGSEVLSDYLQILISSPGVIKKLERDSVGSTMTNLNQKIFSNIEIDLPTIEEQKELIQRARELFKIANQIETRYQKAKTHVEKLTQSILAKAFRGELVPQDPSDPPAADLLKQIKAEREKQQAKSKAQKNPKRKTKRKRKKKT